MKRLNHSSLFSDIRNFIRNCHRKIGHFLSVSNVSSSQIRETYYSLRNEQQFVTGSKSGDALLVSIGLGSAFDFRASLENWLSIEVVALVFAFELDGGVFGGSSAGIADHSVVEFD